MAIGSVPLHRLVKVLLRRSLEHPRWILLALLVFAFLFTPGRLIIFVFVY